jgi:hypothetical protein
LLPEKSYAIKHLFSASPRRVEAGLKLLVLALELRDAAGKLEARRSAFVCFELLQPSFRRQCPATEARELFREMANQSVQLANGGVFNLISVGH